MMSSSVTPAETSTRSNAQDATPLAWESRDAGDMSPVDVLPGAKTQKKKKKEKKKQEKKKKTSKKKKKKRRKKKEEEEEEEAEA